MMTYIGEYKTNDTNDSTASNNTECSSSSSSDKLRDLLFTKCVSVLLMGFGGSGKSYIIRQMVIWTWNR